MDGSVSQNAHLILRSAHIALGALALVLFWVPVFSRKGSKTHIYCGRIFSIVALLVAATAAISCIWALGFPVDFSGIERDLTADEVSALSGNIRFLFSILATLMTWLVASVVMGWQVARRKESFHINSFWSRASWWLAGAVSGGLLVYGFSLVVGGNLNGLVLAAIGGFGVMDSRKYLRLLKQGGTSPKDWWFIHMELMLGSGIAIYTAFFVFGFKGAFGLSLTGAWAIIPWLIPAAIGVPATSIWSNYYRKKFAGQSSL